MVGSRARLTPGNQCRAQTGSRSGLWVELGRPKIAELCGIRNGTHLGLRAVDIGILISHMVRCRSSFLGRAGQRGVGGAGAHSISLIQIKIQGREHWECEILARSRWHSRTLDSPLVWPMKRQAVGHAVRQDKVGLPVGVAKNRNAKSWLKLNSSCWFEQLAEPMRDTLHGIRNGHCDA